MLAKRALDQTTEASVAA